jgi:hypothetical protein
MFIAESTADAAAAQAFSLAHRGACELFAEPQRTHCLALVSDASGDEAAWTFTPVQPLFEGGRHGPGAGEWLLCVGLWVPADQRGEFLAWYEQDHLPILLECPMWDGCRFVEAPHAQGCQFFALHQLSDRAALDSAERARSRATPWFRRLKRFEWFDEPFTRILYRRVESNES